MPSPFPGIDPYVESPAFWRGFHNMLVTFLTRYLNERLPPGLAANYDERVYIMPAEQWGYPDVAIRRAAPYADPPPVPLGEEDAAWADALLRERGLRA